MSKIKKIILSFCFIFLVCLGSVHALGTINLQSSVTSGKVNLTWNNPYNDTKNYPYGYKIMRSVDGSAYAPISTWQEGEKVKVLNVKPGDAPQSLTQWMRTAGKGLIDVTEITFNSFNADPNAYLKDPYGRFMYDVIVFGTSDCNNCDAHTQLPSGNVNRGEDLNAASRDATLAFMNAGKGVLFGHDTIVMTTFASGSKNPIAHPYLASFAARAGLSVNAAYDGTGDSGRTATQVKVVKSGLLTKFPWEISNQTLTIPKTHTLGQYAGAPYGSTIWMNLMGRDDFHRTDANGGQADWYLATKDNLAMIQTGHDAKFEPTLDEEKVFANTIFYLKQLTDRMYSVDNDSYDSKPPTTLKAETNTCPDNGIQSITLSATDQGNTYKYYVEGNPERSGWGSKTTSNVITTNTATGIKGYIVTAVNASTAVTAKPAATDSRLQTSNIYQAGLISGKDTYVHFYAVDNANNVSAEMIYKIPVICGSFTGTMMDMSSSFIPGTQVMVKGTDYQKTFTADDKGKVQIDHLMAGSYTLQQTAAVSGYLLDPTVYRFQVTAGSNTAMQLKIAEPTAALSLRMEDTVTGGIPQGNASFAGAQYMLYAKTDIKNKAGTITYHRANDSVAVITTKADGTSDDVLHLKPGSYAVRQTKAAPGYNLDAAVYELSFTYVDQNTSVIHQNLLVKSSVISQAFSLINIRSNHVNTEVEPVIGAQFTIKSKQDVDTLGWDQAPIIYDSTHHEVPTMITDDRGYALSPELPYGTYVVRNTYTPPDLDTPDDFLLEIKTDSREPQTWRILNSQPFESYIKVKLWDEKTGKPIIKENAAFKIKNLDKNMYVSQWIYYPIPHKTEVFETENGAFISPNLLLPGSYQLEQVDHLDGYERQSDPIPFRITSSYQYELMPDQVTPLIVIDTYHTPVKGDIQIQSTGEVFTGVEETETPYGTQAAPIFTEGNLAGISYQITAEESIIGKDGTLWYEKDEVVHQFTSGNELTTIKELPPGEYRIHRLDVKPGYIGKDMDCGITISDQQSALYEKEFRYEKERLQLTVHKTFEASDFIKDETAAESTVFGVYAAESIFVDGRQVIETDQLIQVLPLNERLEAEALLDLAGSYHIKEMSAHDSYRQMKEPRALMFRYGSGAVEEKALDVTNELRRGSIHIHAKDNEEQPVEELTYEIYLDPDMTELYLTGKTDKDGNVSFDHLEPHDYYVKVKEEKGSHALNTTVYPVTITEDEQQEELDVIHTRIRGSISLTIYDEEETILTQEEQDLYGMGVQLQENMFSLPGTAFEISDRKDFQSILYTGLSDQNGSISFVELPAGTYYIRQSTALYHYVKDQKVYEISIDQPLQQHQLNIRNELRRSIIQVKVEDGMGGQAVQGAEFMLCSDEECQNVIDTGVSDDLGILNFKGLLNGEYFIQQASAASGYRPYEEVISLTIATNEPAAVYKVTIINEKILFPVKEQNANVGDVKTGDQHRTGFFWMLIIPSLLCLVILQKKRVKKHE